jgi:hypothetical protein
VAKLLEKLMMLQALVMLAAIVLSVAPSAARHLTFTQSS